jgi:hypothetical protein
MNSKQPGQIIFAVCHYQNNCNRKKSLKWKTDWDRSEGSEWVKLLSKSLVGIEMLQSG